MQALRPIRVEAGSAPLPMDDIAVVSPFPGATGVERSEMLTLRQAAGLSGRTVTAIRKAIRAGELAAQSENGKRGVRLSIARTDLERWVAAAPPASQAGPAPDAPETSTQFWADTATTLSARLKAERAELTVVREHARKQSRAASAARRRIATLEAQVWEMEEMRAHLLQLEERISRLEAELQPAKRPWTHLFKTVQDRL